MQKNAEFFSDKRGCVFSMVIWPAFRMGQYRVNDHPYHAPQFILENSCFFDFFEVFHEKLLNAIEPSHVLGTIRIVIKFHVGLSMSGRWGRLGKNDWALSQINLHKNVTENHRTVINGNAAY